MKKAHMSFALAVLFTVIGSAQAQIGVVSLGGGSTVGPANPSSAYCTRLHGQNIAVSDRDGGQFGLCAFGRGQIEAWTFYRQKHGTPTLAVTKFLTHEAYVPTPVAGMGIPNPSAAYCAQLGGTSEAAITAAGESAVCKFSDNSSIEEWTLFRGPSDSTNTALVNALR